MSLRSFIHMDIRNLYRTYILYPYQRARYGHDERLKYCFCDCYYEFLHGCLKDIHNRMENNYRYNFTDGTPKEEWLDRITSAISACECLLYGKSGTKEIDKALRTLKKFNDYIPTMWV